MMEIDPILNTAVILLLAVILWFVFTQLKSAKNLPPGPRGVPFFGYLPLLGRKPHLTFSKLRIKYGDMFKIYLGEELVIVLSSFKLIKEALLKQTFQERPSDFIALTAFGPEEGLFSGFGPSRVELRRFVLTMLRNFGMGKTSLEPRMQDEINCAIEEIAKLEGKPADFRNLLTMSASNLIVSILFGKRMSYTNPVFQELLNSSKNYVNSIGINQWSNLLPHFLLNWLGIKTPLYLGKLLYKKMLEELKKHDESSNSENFIDSWRAEAEKSKTNSAIYNEEKLAQVLCELFIGGSDTTSVTLEWALLYLIKHPEVQTKVQKEIDDVIGKEKAPTMSDQKLMPYTQATIMEIVRLTSIVPLNDPHSPIEDTEFNGYFLPKNSSIYTNLWALHRDPEIFSQPEKFMPERFINEDNTVKRVDELIPFSAGRRQCPGEALARMQLFLYLTTFLQHFTFTKHNDVVLDYEYALVLEPVHQQIRAVLR
uniref:Cytochrome P450 n=1 Tax=Strigamia maritima TaxID=126957 RepID=T1JBP5_STRMM